MTELGIGLMVLAALLIVAEAHTMSGGVLGLLALISLAAGSLILYDEHGVGYAVTALVVTLAIAVPAAYFIARKVIRAQREEPVRTGWEELIGNEVEVREPLDPEGQVWAGGALWRARLADGGGRVPLGGRVRIESVDGLTLVVQPVVPEAHTRAERR